MSRDPFTLWSFPLIKNLYPEACLSYLMSVQPMGVDPNIPPSYMETIDKSKPRVGVILHDEDKHPDPNRPPLCGCCRDYWGRVFTPRGWVLEKEHPRKYKAACKKYGTKYKAMIERERKAWNKKYKVKSWTIPMILIFDSSKRR